MVLAIDLLLDFCFVTQEYYKPKLTQNIIRSVIYVCFGQILSFFSPNFFGKILKLKFKKKTFGVFLEYYNTILDLFLEKKFVVFFVFGRKNSPNFLY